MNLRNNIYKKFQRAMVILGLHPLQPQREEFQLSPAEIDQARRTLTNDAQRAFFASEHRPAHKWYHYLDIYHRHLAQYQNKSLFFLEIGVFDGGSLDMWRRYFGAPATIVGIDINPACAERVDPPNIVRIGSQTDQKFLHDVIKEFGSPDIILDDGSHVASHQRASFAVLFPLLKEGGLYIIEDTHTAYWPDWEGGYKRKGSIIEDIKQMIDDMHSWYHRRTGVTPARQSIYAIHVYDSLTVLEKRQKERPGYLSSRR